MYIIFFKLKDNKSLIYLAAYGNDKYNNSTSQITLIVVEQNEEYEITVEANDTLYGDDEIIIVTVPEDAEGTVTISIDGNEIETKEVSGGKAIFNITGLEVHNDYNVTAIYNGDSIIRLETLEMTYSM